MFGQQAVLNAEPVTLSRTERLSRRRDDTIELAKVRPGRSHEDGDPVALLDDLLNLHPDVGELLPQPLSRRHQVLRTRNGPRLFPAKRGRRVLDVHRRHDRRAAVQLALREHIVKKDAYELRRLHANPLVAAALSERYRAGPCCSTRASGVPRITGARQRRLFAVLLLAQTCPDGRWASGPFFRSAMTCSMMTWPRWALSAATIDSG
jgi:hypothetical protein